MSGALKGRFWDQLCSTSWSVTLAVGLSAPSANLLTPPSCVCTRDGRDAIQRHLDRPSEKAALVEGVPSMAGRLRLDGLEGFFSPNLSMGL